MHSRHRTTKPRLVEMIMMVVIMVFDRPSTFQLQNHCTSVMMMMMIKRQQECIPVIELLYLGDDDDNDQEIARVHFSYRITIPR